MSQHFESFILTLVLIADVRTVDMCNSVNHTSTRGYIWLNISHRPEPIRCEHNILAPGNVTTTLRIDRFRGNVGEVKLVIYGSSFPRKDVYPLKKRKIPIYYKTIGNFVTLRILANSWSRAELIMGYFAESNESCAHPKLQCLDGKGCFKTVQICDGIFSCMVPT